MKQEQGRLQHLGLGAAACVACCAGPILAFLGGLGIAGLASTLLIGAAGLLITRPLSPRSYRSSPPASPARPAETPPRHPHPRTHAIGQPDLSRELTMSRSPSTTPPHPIACTATARDPGTH